MEILIYSQEPKLKGMRAIDLNFIQELIRKMQPTEEGKLHTHMVSDDYCKRALVSGLDNFVVVQLPTDSYLILTSISSYYHASIYFEDFSHFTAIAVLTEESAHIKLITKELESHPQLIVPGVGEFDHINEEVARKTSYSNILQAHKKTVILNTPNKKVQFVTSDLLVEALNKGNSLDNGYLAVNIKKNYELPITTISNESPGIVL